MLNERIPLSSQYDYSAHTHNTYICIVDKTWKWKNTHSYNTCRQKEGNFAAHFPRNSLPCRHNLRSTRAFDVQSCASAFCNHFIAFVPQTAPGQPILWVYTSCKRFFLNVLQTGSGGGGVPRVEKSYVYCACTIVASLSALLSLTVREFCACDICRTRMFVWGKGWGGYPHKDVFSNNRRRANRSAKYNIIIPNSIAKCSNAAVSFANRVRMLPMTKWARCSETNFQMWRFCSFSQFYNLNENRENYFSIKIYITCIPKRKVKIK